MSSLVELFSRRMSPSKKTSTLPTFASEPHTIRPRSDRPPPPPPPPQPSAPSTAYFHPLPLTNDRLSGVTLSDDFAHLQHRSQTPPMFHPIGKRRSSWTNLLESSENLPKLANNPTMQTNGLATIGGGFPLMKNSVDGSVASSRQSHDSGFFFVGSNSMQKLNPASKNGLNHGKKSIFCRPKCIIPLVIVLLLIMVLAIILTMIIRQLTTPPSTYHFTWKSPPHLQGQTNDIYMNARNDTQVVFTLKARPPFKTDSKSIYDFRSGYAIQMDMSLKDGHKYLFCFLMDLNRTAMRNIDSIRQAAANSIDIKTQRSGWKENWHLVPEPMDKQRIARMFSEDSNKLTDCMRWMKLRYVAEKQKEKRCQQCYDFCLPDFGIEKDISNNDNYLNIVRRNCFYLFVPEWSKFASNSQWKQGDGQLASGNGFNFNGYDPRNGRFQPSTTGTPWNGRNQQGGWSGQRNGQGTWNNGPNQKTGRNWNEQQQTKWNDQQQTSWNGQQRANGNGRQQQTEWNDQQQTEWNDQQQANWNGQQQTKWNDQQQASWNGLQRANGNGQHQANWNGQQMNSNNPTVNKQASSNWNEQQTNWNGHQVASQNNQFPENHGQGWQRGKR